MEELQIRCLEGRWGRQIEYVLHYPATAGGNTPFDRYWQQRIRQLRRSITREPGWFPTRYASEWQETRRDGRFCSGFLESTRKIGYSDWTLWRVSGTFGTQSPSPILLSSLLGNDWKRTLQPLTIDGLSAIAEGETPFFKGWQHRMGSLMRADRYYLTGEGLCLWFPQETLAPKNAGLPSILLPYDRLDILRHLC